MQNGQSESPRSLSPPKRMAFQTVPIKDLPEPVLRGNGSKDRPVVLVVHEVKAVAETVLELLNRNGYAAILAKSGKDAIETALLIPPELVIAEARLPDMSGEEVAAALKSKLPGTKVLLFGEQASALELLEAAKKARHGIELVEKRV